MRGAVVMTLLLPYEDAPDIERRTEVKMVAEPGRWESRTDAILGELNLGERTQLVPTGVGVTLEASAELVVPHLIPARIIDAELIVNRPGSARRRSLHQAYLEALADEEAFNSPPEETDCEDDD